MAMGCNGMHGHGTMKYHEISWIHEPLESIIILRSSKEVMNSEGCQRRTSDQVRSLQSVFIFATLSMEQLKRWTLSGSWRKFSGMAGHPSAKLWWNISSRSRRYDPVFDYLFYKCYLYICMYIYIDRIWYAVHCMYVVCNSLYIYIYTHYIIGTRTYLPLFDMILKNIIANTCCFALYIP